MSKSNLLNKSDLLCRMCSNRQGRVTVVERRYVFDCPCCGYSAPIRIAFNNYGKSKQVPRNTPQKDRSSLSERLRDTKDTSDEDATRSKDQSLF